MNTQILVNTLGAKAVMLRETNFNGKQNDDETLLYSKLREISFLTRALRRSLQHCILLH
jgi:hypothetical protein